MAWISLAVIPPLIYPIIDAPIALNIAPPGRMDPLIGLGDVAQAPPAPPRRLSSGSSAAKLRRLP
eukprot:4737677-Pyramimonas_sp.AAC.1